MNTIPINRDVILRTWKVPHAIYKVDPVYSESGKLLNKREYYASREISFTNDILSYQVNNPEYFKVKLDYIKLINSYREKMQDQFIGGMPVQIEGDCIRQLLRINPQTNELAYSITLKVDGERFLMYINNESQVYFLDRSTNITDLGIYFPGLQNCILDGELVTHNDSSKEYLVFDVLFYNGVSVMGRDYPGRYLVSKEILSKIPSTPLFSCSLKEWFPITKILETNDIYKLIRDLTNKTRSSQKKPLLIADGLVLQPNDGTYVPFREWNTYNNVQFKWKPPDQLTIDFKIKRISDKKWVLLTGTDEQYMISQSKGDPLPAMCEPTKDDLLRYSNGEVVEFQLKRRANPQRNLFIPMRSRNEKKANSYRTIMSTLNAIENNFNLDSVKEGIKSITNPFTNESFKKILLYFSYSNLILWNLYFQKSMFFTPKEIESIKEVYLKIPEVKNPEFECRIYNFTKNKKSGLNINKGEFFYLHDFFWRSFPMEIENTVDMYLNTFSKIKYRSTYDNLDDIYSGSSRLNTAKQSIKSYSLVPSDPKNKLYNNLTMKIDLSSEEPSDQIIGVKTQIEARKVTNNIRVKSRKSFKINELWRVDFTRIKTSYSISDVLEKNEMYELECEYIGGNIPFDDFLKSLNDLYMIILSNSSYC
jgi:hypothetical protein